MALYTNQVTLPLDTIALEDKAFVITFGRSCDGLARAIERAGLVNPPVLSKLPGQDTYRIVCGSLRVQALRHLGFREIPARVLQPGCPDVQILELSLCDNLGHRAPNSVEQAGAVKRLLNYLPETQVTECWLPLLGLPPYAKALENCQRIDGLEQEIKQALAAGAISGHSAAELALLSAEDRLAVYGLFSSVHLSASKQAEIIETCSDLARRDGTDIQAILRSAGIAAVLADPNPDLSHKGEQVRRFLRRCRFPRLTRKEEQFSALAKELPRLGGVRLVPSQSFEGDTYRLEIAFSRPESLADAAQTVQALAQDMRLRNLCEDGP
jgi:ParB-like chromosome segregation protein Spo0J